METTTPLHLAAPRSHPARPRSARVLAVPAAHAYVRALGVRTLPDPRPPGAEPGRWWPPPALDPAWLAANLDRFDLVHVHFGTESVPAATLRAALDVLAAAGKPVVHTVHDLEHPQLTDPDGNAPALRTLVERSAALITLTPGAAERIRRRYGRRAVVIEHPAMVPLDVPRPVGQPGRRPVVGVHLRDLRPNVDGPGTVRALLGAAVRLGPLKPELRVRMHDDVRDPHAAETVEALCATSGIDLHVGPRPGDVALDRELADLDVSVLPYSHGTHSGWIEHCWDLGVAVAAPAIGCLADQHGDASFAPADPASLAATLDTLLRTVPRPGTAARRALQDRRRKARAVAAPRIAAAHADVYESVLGR